MILPEEEARQRRVKQLEQQARDKKAAEAAAKEKDAQRQWILQYAEEDSESDPNEDQMEQVSPCTICVLSSVCSCRHIISCMPRADNNFSSCLGQTLWCCRQRRLLRTGSYGVTLGKLRGEKLTVQEQLSPFMSAKHRFPKKTLQRIGVDAIFMCDKYLQGKGHV